jgi:homoserine trans-succinylase
MKDPKQILDLAYSRAENVIAKNIIDDFKPLSIKQDIDTFLDKIETDKSLVQVIVTSPLARVVNQLIYFTSHYQERGAREHF